MGPMGPQGEMGPAGLGGLTREEVQAMIDASLEGVVRYGEGVALKSSGQGTKEGMFLCAEHGGPEKEWDPFELTGKKEIGPWETWIISR